MAGKPKDPKLRMDTDLRTPVTADQKALIQRAAEADGLGLAPWCRLTLLRVAKEQSRKRRSNTQGGD
jgi:uncharacterized protein (DUF1778 family)